MLWHYVGMPVLLQESFVPTSELSFHGIDFASPLEYILEKNDFSQKWKPRLEGWFGEKFVFGI